jgi:hypothetical protein
MFDSRAKKGAALAKPPLFLRPFRFSPIGSPTRTFDVTLDTSATACFARSMANAKRRS